MTGRLPPGGIPSHVAAETPGSVHEGGELGYSLVHAYGAAFDNPDLLVLCVVDDDDDEAETGAFRRHCGIGAPAADDVERGPAAREQPVMDDHIIYAITLVALLLAGAGATLGLGKAWNRVGIVQRHSFLR